MKRETVGEAGKILAKTLRRQIKKEKKLKKARKLKKKLYKEYLQGLTEESFRSLPGYDGLYEVGDKGTVIALEREVKGRYDNTYIKNKFIKTQHVNKAGYHSTRLTDENGINKKIDIHRLVAITWCANPNDKCCVNHIDADKSNNSKENLEWVTYKENTQHAMALGLLCQGEDHNNSKLTKSDIIKIRAAKNITNKALAEIFQVSRPLISKIKNNKRWKHIK